MRGYVDANVILRFITGDPPEMAAQSAALFWSVENGETVVVVDEIVVAEVVWVLESFYHYKVSDIAPVVREFLLQEGIGVRKSQGAASGRPRFFIPGLPSSPPSDRARRSGGWGRGHGPGPARAAGQR